MPAEPERDIEKKLKAYAQQRREQAGAPLELHPATRRMLQAAAARQRATDADQRSFWSEMAGFVRRHLVNVSAVAALFLVVTLLLALTLVNARHHEMAYSSRSVGGALQNQPATLPSPGELAKAKSPDNSLDDKKAFSTSAPATPSSQAPAVALNEPATVSAAEKQKDASLALNRPGTRLDANPRAGNPAETAALAQSTVAAPPTVNAEAEAADRKLAQTTAPPAAFANESRSAKAIAAPPPDNAPAFARQRAETLRDTSSNSLAFKSDAAPAPLPVDGLTLSQAAAPAVPAGVPAQTSPTSTAPSAFNANEFALSDAEAPNGAVTQRFYRLTEALRKTSAKVSKNRGLLDSFRVEQSGGAMRIVDGDGSVYAGFVRVADQPTTEFDAAAAPVAASAEAVAPAASGAISGRAADALKSAPPASPVPAYYFRVTGTNRTLRQPVVFSGTFTPTAPVVTGVRTGAQSHAVATLGAAKPATVALPLSRSQLRGRALVGGTNSVDVSAAPSPMTY